jgi:hypothetical protein
MAAELTPSQQAYARIIADEYARHGRCDRTLDELAARAGCCWKTAQRAQARLEELGWISVSRRKIDARMNLPNYVKVVSREWLTWIKHGAPSRIGRHFCPPAGNKKVNNVDCARAQHQPTALQGVRKHFDSA